MGDKGKFGLEKKDLDPTNFHSSNMSSSDWRFEETNLTTQPLGLAPNEKSNYSPCKGDLIMGSSAPSSSVSMADSFCPVLWDHHVPNSSQQLGSFCETNVSTSATSTLNPLLIRKGFPVASRAGGIDKALDMGWNPLNSMYKGGALFLQTGAAAGFPPQSHLSQFPADSAFIERAARFSCFNGGNFSDVVNPFSNISESMNPYSSRVVVAPIQGSQEALHGSRLKALLGHQSQKNDLDNSAEPGKEISMSIERGTTEDSPIMNDKEKGSSAAAPDEAKQENAGACSNESDDAEFSGSGGQVELPVLGNADGEPSSKALSTKKRKRPGQNAELDQAKGASHSLSEPVKDDKAREMADQNPASATGKAAGKQGKDGSQASDAPKEEYIHVRARRGQATNSHSLAERVRREKISERMKFLQDLVPGCSKVTGKAVMLDEIINYVQSLQRQVEFLSMKLATVNPTLDFNIEGLLTKEILQARGGPSTLGFSPDLAIGHHPLHPSQQGLIQAGVSSMGNPSEALRSSNNSQLNPLNSGYKELPPQLYNAWDDELHNVIQMNFGANAPYNSQDLNGSLPPGHMKVEL